MSSKQVGAVVVCALVATIAACSKEVPITPEGATGAASSSGTQGAGAGGGLSSTAASTGAGSGGNSSSSSSGGAGCCIPGPIQVQGTVKTITADTDIAQYFSGSVQGSNQTPVKVVDGPAFIMDLSGGGGISLFTIPGMDCAAPLPHAFIYGAANGTFHGHNLRIPILSGQSLCEEPTGLLLNYTGFKPY